MPTSLGYSISSPAVAPPPGETTLGASALTYARQLKHLLPPGLLFLLLPDSWISKALEAIGTELARVHFRGADLIEESDPRTATELLEDYERVLGLPDGCVLELPATTAERRNAIAAKVVARGGQTAAFYIAIAASMGVTATVSEKYALVLRSGFRSGDRCYGLDQAFTWQVDTTGGLAAGLFLPPPVISSVQRVFSLGGMGAGTYTYRVSAINALGQTLASVAVGNTTFLADSVMRITWAAVPEATGYKVYGRTAGAELLIATLGNVLTYDDGGGVVPAGALPATNTAFSKKGTSLECIIRRARPAHTNVVFVHAP